jgi:hypothetical protein
MRGGSRSTIVPSEGRIGRLRARAVAVGLEVDGEDEAYTGRGLEGSAALDEDHALARRDKQIARQIVAHGGLDPRDPRFGVGVLEVGLGEDEAEGRGRASDEGRGALPILPLGGVLIAGDDGPLAVIGSRGGQVDFGHARAHRGQGFFVARHRCLPSRFSKSVAFEIGLAFSRASFISMVALRNLRKVLAAFSKRVRILKKPLFI